MAAEDAIARPIALVALPTGARASNLSIIYITVITLTRMKLKTFRRPSLRDARRGRASVAAPRAERADVLLRYRPIRHDDRCLRTVVGATSRRSDTSLRNAAPLHDHVGVYGTLQPYAPSLAREPWAELRPIAAKCLPLVLTTTPERRSARLKWLSGPDEAGSVWHGRVEGTQETLIV